MIAFIFGGAGGIVNASFNLNMLVHNTAWIPGHFHLTVGTAVTLTFFGITFWLLPAPPAQAAVLARDGAVGVVDLVRRDDGVRARHALAGHPGRAAARLHLQPAGRAGRGLRQRARADGDHRRLRRHPDGGRDPLLHGRLRHGVRAKRLADADVPQIPWASARSYKSEGIIKFMDQLSVWMGLAIFLVAIAYLPSLITMLAQPAAGPGLPAVVRGGPMILELTLTSVLTGLWGRR
jgi:cytochrome c oxidase subunit I